MLEEVCEINNREETIETIRNRGVMRRGKERRGGANELGEDKKYLAQP